MGYVKWSYDTLNHFCGDVFKAFGFSEEEGSIIKDVLLTADLYGIAEKECLFGRDRIENKEIPYRICKMICVLYSGNISEIGKGFFMCFYISGRGIPRRSLHKSALQHVRV